MKPSCFIKAVFPLLFAFILLLQGCDQGSLKFIESIEQSSSIIQALATALEKELKINILDQAFDLENSTRVVFTPSGQLTAKQLSLISPAAAVALLTEDAITQTATSKTMDSLLSAVLLGNILADNLLNSPSDRKISVTRGEFLIDNHKTYRIKKIESTKGVGGFINRLEISMESSGIQSIKMIVQSLPGGIRYASFSIKKSSSDTFFIEAQGKLKQSGLTINLLNYEIKKGPFQVKDRHESKSGLSLTSLIANQLISGSDTSVEDVLEISQSDDTAVSELIHQILMERNDNEIIQQALDWEQASRLTFTRDKPLNASQKKLMPLVALTALLAKDTNQLLADGKTKEISFMLAEAVATMFGQMALMPLTNTSMTQGKLLVDGSSDFKFTSAAFAKKNGKSSISIKFNSGRSGVLTLDVTVPVNGTPVAAFNLKTSAEGKSIGMKVVASETSPSPAVTRYITFITKGSNLVNSMDITRSSGISADDLIINHLLAGNLISVEELRSLFEIEKTFSGSIEAAEGDLADIVTDFDLGNVHVEFTGTDNVIFSYKPGDVEYTVTGIINGNDIQIPETSLQGAAFVSETLGKCIINDAKISGDCTILNQNTISCSLTLTGDVVDSSPAFCFIPKDNSETSMDVVFTVN